MSAPLGAKPRPNAWISGNGSRGASGADSTAATAAATDATAGDLRTLTEASLAMARAKLIGSLWLLLLAGCQQLPSGSGRSPSNADPLSIAVPELWAGERLPTRSERRQFPLTSYEPFPEDIRALLQQREIEQERCLGGSAWGMEISLSSCNRRYAVDLDLQRRGWCIGRSKSGVSAVFLMCSQDPGHRPGALAASGPPYRQDEIDWYVRARRAADAGQSLPRPVPARSEPSYEALQALRQPVNVALLRTEPLNDLRRYPAALRPWMQRAQIEHRRCDYTADNVDPDRLLACNRRYHLLVELERHGWCSRGYRRWERCSSTPGHVPGLYEMMGPPHRQSYLDWAIAYRQSQHR